MSDVPEHELEVRPEPMFVMADLLDDPNPIHLDPEAVRRMGLGDRVINQGPSNCGYVVAMLRKAYPELRLARLSLKLTGQVRGGDRVVAGGRVTEADGDRVRCDVWLDVVGGERAVSGSAELTSRAAAAPR